VKDVCQALVNQRQTLLAFVKPLDETLATLAGQAQVPVATVRELLWVQMRSPKGTRRWQREAALRQQLRGRYHALSVAVAKVVRRVVRASSAAENLNGRLQDCGKPMPGCPPCGWPFLWCTGGARLVHDWCTLDTIPRDSRAG